MWGYRTGSLVRELRSHMWGCRLDLVRELVHICLTTRRPKHGTEVMWLRFSKDFRNEVTLKKKTTHTQRKMFHLKLSTVALRIRISKLPGPSSVWCQGISVFQQVSDTHVQAPCWPYLRLPLASPCRKFSNTSLSSLEGNAFVRLLLLFTIYLLNSNVLQS